MASMNYCPISEISSWTCGYNCDALPNYNFFFVTDVAVSSDSEETFSFSMLYNEVTKRFVTSFRGTKGYTELAIEILDSVVPVPYTIHNITNAWIDSYFQVRYTGML